MTTSIPFSETWSPRQKHSNSHHPGYEYDPYSLPPALSPHSSLCPLAIAQFPYPLSPAPTHPLHSRPTTSPSQPNHLAPAHLLLPLASTPNSNPFPSLIPDQTFRSMTTPRSDDPTHTIPTPSANRLHSLSHNPMTTWAMMPYQFPQQHWQASKKLSLDRVYDRTTHELWQ